VRNIIDYIDLSETGAYIELDVSHYSYCHAIIDADEDTFSGTDWVVTIKWSSMEPDMDGERVYGDFSGSITLNASNPTYANIPVPDVESLRFLVTTADTSADQCAKLHVRAV
jgi:hypothetical protein